VASVIVSITMLQMWVQVASDSATRQVKFFKSRNKCAARLSVRKYPIYNGYIQNSTNENVKCSFETQACTTSFGGNVIFPKMFISENEQRRNSQQVLLMPTGMAKVISF